MEYTQMILTEWIDMKQKLRQELLGVKQSFVRIGYVLRKIEDQKLYEQDGYKGVAEFAKAEYGLEGSTVSRFMSINREYSVDGYSEHLRPEYLDLSRSQLEEMLQLPDSDRQMIRPGTPREDIRELKRFNKEAPAAGEPDDIRRLIKQFYHDNDEVLNAVFGEAARWDEPTDKWFVEIVNPSGNRSYRSGMYFLMMYEDRILIKKFGEAPQNMTWSEFRKLTEELFVEYAEGPRTWQNAFWGQGEDLVAMDEAEKEEQEHPKRQIAPAQKPVKIEENQELGQVVEPPKQEPEASVENVDKPVETYTNCVQSEKSDNLSEENPENTVTEDEIEGQDNIEEHPEWLPEGYEKPKAAKEDENAGNWRLIGQAKAVFAELKQNMAQQDYKAALENGRKFVGYLEQMEEVSE